MKVAAVSNPLVCNVSELVPSKTSAKKDFKNRKYDVTFSPEVPTVLDKKKVALLRRLLPEVDLIDHHTMTC